MSERSDVPAMTCQLAQVCRRSCQRSGAMRARRWAALKPWLLPRSYGSPSSFGNTQRGCLPFCVVSTAMAWSLSGEPIARFALTCVPATHATLRLRSIRLHSKRSTFCSRQPVASAKR
ncbi:hypothetical protein IA64_07445 [Xanthomonas arboricola pv. celebensis]|nr:hypothetical protein IA64_07445 [Xanthomonas arboricola pv. celebensis]